MNIQPSNENIEALLNHFSDDSITNTSKNSDESPVNKADKLEATKASVMTNIENTLVAKRPDASISLVSSSSSASLQYQALC